MFSKTWFSGNNYSVTVIEFYLEFSRQSRSSVKKRKT
jgi:hypothetical protein